MLRAGGILVTSCCIGLVPRQEFLKGMAAVSRHTGRHFRILESLGQPEDHPVSATCPETEHLKVLICRVS